MIGFLVTDMDLLVVTTSFLHLPIQVSNKSTAVPLVQMLWKVVSTSWLHFPLEVAKHLIDVLPVEIRYLVRMLWVNSQNLV